MNRQDTYYTIEEYRAARINNDTEYEAAIARCEVLWQRDWSNSPAEIKEWWLLEAVIRAYEIRCDKEIEQD